MDFSQDDFDVRFDWGLDGLKNVAGGCNAVIIIDVLSFCTSVDIALTRGATIFPARPHDGTCEAFARSRQALIANSDPFAIGGYTLSPSSLLTIETGTRLVLPSEDGATLCLEAEKFFSAAPQKPTLLCGSLRNARAVARAAQSLGPRIAVIAAGDSWANGNLRPALEDQWGGGAIIHYLKGLLSPEAQAAACAFESFSRAALHLLRHCASGRQLLEAGCNQDIELAAGLNDSDSVPVLVEGAFFQLHASLELAS
ncbi:MAG: 2-phosphosulfolactate phosphatase [Cyanobacteria bacterium SZAS LIN-2]|nr:2-phosphosulfolactate phosphatase [Cyanobacteria bacterium SZAS LIN-2]